MAGCGSCGGNKVKADQYTWTSNDGKQVVRNLTVVQAKTRVNNKGGSYAKQ